MVDLFSVENSQLNRGMQLLRDEFKLRGWTAQIPYIGSPHCFIDRGDGNDIHIFATTPPTVSYAAAHLANDKFATYQVLKTTNIPQPKTVLAEADSVNEQATLLLSEVGKVVVKPLDAGHGKGITVGVTSQKSLDTAIACAVTFTKNSRSVIVQQQYDYPTIYDIRLACVNFKFVAATLRVPAWVTADGTSTVIKLICDENESGRRGVPYHSPLAKIDEDAACEYLGKDKETVYPKGHKVQVLGVANYGAGGEIHDITDEIPGWLVTVAEDVAKKIDLPVCGVDFMTKKRPFRGAIPRDIDAQLIEVNKSPSLAIHDLPGLGESRHAVAKYVNYLANFDEEDIMRVESFYNYSNVVS